MRKIWPTSEEVLVEEPRRSEAISDEKRCLYSTRVHESNVGDAFGVAYIYIQAFPYGFISQNKRRHGGLRPQGTDPGYSRE